MWSCASATASTGCAGLRRTLSLDMLKVNLRVLGVNTHGDMALHVDTLEMNSARHRMAFAKQAAEELRVKEEIVRHDLSQVLLKLEELRDEQISEGPRAKEPEDKMTEQERAAALELLRDPRLHGAHRRGLRAVRRGGRRDKQARRLSGRGVAASGRAAGGDRAVVVRCGQKLADGCGAGLRAGGAAGAVLRDDGPIALLHGRNRSPAQGACHRRRRRARSARPTRLKLLQSEGELSIAATGKDPVSGRHVTHEYRVKGPVMIFLTTTAIDMDEELLNRCLVLTVNEDREQTQAIHRMQREAQTLEGLLRRQSGTRCCSCTATRSVS